MMSAMRVAVLTVAMLAMGLSAHGQEISREQIKGLDEQIQEIKGDIIAIAAELSQLEEKLLYPSDTQISLFVSLSRGEKMELDGVEIRLNGKTVVHHLYTFKELEALRKGGVQRIHTGNVKTGEHDLQVSFLARADGSEIRRSENFTVRKGVGPGIVEIIVASSRITIKE